MPGDIWAGSVLFLGQNGSETVSEIWADITLRKLIQASLSVLLAYILILGAQFLTHWFSERVPRRFRLIIKQSLPFWKALILLLMATYLLHLFLRLSQGNLLALTGTLAVALGFAFKDYISSIIAGVVSLFEGAYRVGDRVQIGEHYGEVVGYGLRSFRLQTPDDNTITVPHNKVWTDAISNANSGQLEAQVVTDFYFGHGVNIDQIVQILYQAAYSSRYTQLKLSVIVVIAEKPWGTHFRLKSYPMDARDEFIYQTDLTRRAKQAFARLDLPYPRVSARFDED